MVKRKTEKIDENIQVKQTHENKEYGNDGGEELDEWRRLEKWRPGRRNFA